MARKEKERYCYAETRYTTTLLRECPARTKKEAKEAYETGICEVADDWVDEEEFRQIKCLNKPFSYKHY